MDGPSAQGFLSLTAFQAEGCGIARRAMSFISRLRRSRQHRVSILSAYLVHPFPLRGTSPQGETRALRDWLSVSYSMISTLVISRYAAPPYPAAPDFLHGKACHTILRLLCSLTNRVPLPPHPGDRINHSMLSYRDMAPLLSTHSAPACGGKVVAPATKGGMHFLSRRAVVKVSL